MADSSSQLGKAHLGTMSLGSGGGGGGPLTLLPSAVSATFSLQSPFLIVSGATTIFPSRVSAGFAVRAATLAFSAVSLTVGPVGANFRVRPATLIAIPLPCSRAVGPMTTGCILENLYRQIGLTPDEYDVTVATDIVDGFILGDRTPVRDAVDALLRVFQLDLVEYDGKIIAKKRGGAAVATLTEEDLGAKLGSGGDPDPKVKSTIKQDLELPVDADITFFSAERDYEQAQERDTRYTITDVDEKLTLQTPLVLNPSFARQTISRLLYQIWVERETFVFVLTPKWLYLAAGDVVNLPVAGGTARVRLIAIDVALFGPVSCEAVLDEIGILTQTITTSDDFDRGDETGISENTALRVWSSNALRDVDADAPGFYAVANGETEGADWLGGVLYMSRDTGTTYSPIADLSDPATYGITTNTLAAPSPLTTGQFDRTNFVDVTIQAGSPPVSASETEVINGANPAYIGGEMIQYVTSTPLGGDSYRLSNLLRGRRGTDPFWSSHANGDLVVLLENGGATVRVEVDEGLVGKTVLLKAVSTGQTVAAASPVSLTITGNEFKCYAGHALKGTRDLSLNLTIDWFRRTRKGGQWKDFVDADQPEATEAYEVDIFNGLTLVRTITGLSSSTATYSAADQTTDFGSPQASVSVVVYQLGRYGRGYPLAGSI